MAKDFKRIIKTLFIASLIVNLLFVGYWAGKRIFYRHERFFARYGIVRTHKRFNSRWVGFIDSKPDSLELIFAGTSLTQGFPVQVAFNNGHIKNLGFGGNKNSQLLHQVKKYIGRHPRKLFLEAGINDFRYGLSVDTAFQNFVKICTVIKTRSPATRLYVQSVLPTNVDSLNGKIRLYDQKIAAYCHNQGITYIDLYPAFIKGNLINKYLTTDGVHLNETGYLLWKRAIEWYVVE